MASQRGSRWGVSNGVPKWGLEGGRCGSVCWVTKVFEGSNGVPKRGFRRGSQNGVFEGGPEGPKEGPEGGSGSLKGGKGEGRGSAKGSPEGLEGFC